jgi:phosphoribosylformylglycinamidine synthase
LISGEEQLDTYHILALPGGFTYGDDIAAGKILATRFRHCLAESITRFIEKGKLILGICNGFQALVKAGFLPGFPDRSDPEVTLTYNDSNKFEARWITLECRSPLSPLAKVGERFFLPVAHGEGKFVTKGKAARKRLASADQIVFRYIDPWGGPCSYPHNPNGSEDDIAGICDPTGRILGLMPHPERYVERFQHPRWTRQMLDNEGDGLKMFRRAIRYTKAF